MFEMECGISVLTGLPLMEREEAAVWLAGKLLSGIYVTAICKVASDNPFATGIQQAVRLVRGLCFSFEGRDSLTHVNALNIQILITQSGESLSSNLWCERKILVTC